MVTRLIKDKKGKPRAMILSIKAYNKLLADSEELAEIKAFDALLSKKESTILLKEAINLKVREQLALR